MGSSLVLINNNNSDLVPNGHKELIAKMIKNFIPNPYATSNSEYDFFYELDSWMHAWVTVNLNIFSTQDFNTVVEALEKGRQYLDTLITKEQQKEFAEDYIGISVFNDLKFYVDEVLKHCYLDPRYQPININ